MQKVLVAYFSCSGVTKKLAQTLAGVVAICMKLHPRSPTRRQI